jgi:hypothetical protein
MQWRINYRRRVMKLSLPAFERTGDPQFMRSFALRSPLHMLKVVVPMTLPAQLRIVKEKVNILGWFDVTLTKGTSHL